MKPITEGFTYKLDRGSVSTGPRKLVHASCRRPNHRVTVSDLLLGHRRLAYIITPCVALSGFLGCIPTGLVIDAAEVVDFKNVLLSG